MKQRKLIKLVCALTCCAMLMFVTGCGGETDVGDAPGEKDTLSVVIAGDIGTLDPHDNTNFHKHQASRQIYETLVVRDENGTLVPWLADSWEYEDDETIIFKIKEGIHFHNGDELKASDVLFSLKRAKDDNTTGAVQVVRMDFDRCEVIDDYTLKIVTDGPYATQIAMLENPLISIFSERAFTESGGDFFAAPIGTGPYKVVKYRSGDSLQLEANEDYWRSGEPHIKNLTIRFISDASSRAVEAESGTTDIVYDISANDVARVGSNPNVNLVSTMGMNTSYILFNTAKTPLDDIRVREAIWYALDVPSAIDMAYGVYGAVANGFVSPGVEGRHPDLSPWFISQDQNKAKELLAEAGYADGLTLSIICENSNQQRMDFCEAIQAQLLQVGINLNLDFQEVNTWATNVVNGNIELAIYGLTASTGEAGRILLRWTPALAEYKATNWDNPEYFDLADKALATIDATERNKLFHTMQEMVMESRVALPIWHKEINAALQPNVKGFNLMPTYEQHYLQFVSLE